MGFLDRLLGREPLQQQQQYQRARPSGQPYDVPAPRGGASTEDERAIARYRYLLRTAPPEDIERVHAEAFANLSPEQRQQALGRMSEDLPEAERPRSADPADLARAATRAEMRQPGYLHRSFGGGTGMGGMFAGSMLGTIAGFVVGSAIADAMLGGYDQSPEAAEAGDTSADAGDAGNDGGDAGADTGDAGGDAGGDYAGGDFGAGDFGGGDWGGGDFGGF